MLQLDQEVGKKIRIFVGAIVLISFLLNSVNQLDSLYGDDSVIV